ncbi:PEP-utilizing enzyme [Arthrobacter sp. I2-34]|uniref:PEP-utilizing enzyme n=1 Tax=Arthrobacter hankyongi TaxID=2904801 RepID=A0ABS9LCA2_9MICC|nr:PEP/pyruvate-binding domain-containing protein [Arthrobacter hankyongi]MCG2624319.1 PEP-utilizing enzyme [Arthrobacter hankyongi]
MTYIRQLGEVGRGDLALAGGKGANLGELVQAGLPVPAGFVLLTTAYEAFIEANGIAAQILELAALPHGAALQDYEQAALRIRELFTGGRLPADVDVALRAAYRGLGGEGAAVAVRSSATAEDLASASSAGQQDTYLNIRGAEALAAAVTACWASLWTARAMAYRARAGIDPAAVRLAVVVQDMVDAEAAGVMFTANPANGRPDQLVISAAWGLGESVVGGSVTPDDIVVEAGTGRILSRHTGDKQVMTVRVERGTAEQPVPGERRRQPVLDDTAAAVLARLGEQAAGRFQAPQDIEWALAGGTFCLLQSRPVTALRAPSGEVPTEWPVPYPKGMYFRASIVEQLPDPLSPLFADLIEGSVIRSLRALMTRSFGGKPLHEGDLGFPTVNGYAYYFYSTTGMLRMLGKTLPAVRALARGDAQLGIAGWRDYAHPRYEQQVAGWAAQPAGDLSGSRLLEGVSALLDAGTAYYTAVQSVIPAAATSETCFRQYYDRCVRREGDPPAQTFLLGFDSEPIRAEKSLFSLAAWTRDQPRLAEALRDMPAAALADVLRGGTVPDGPELEWRQWRERFVRHLDRFGHAVYNLDFLTPVPADDPAPLLATFKYYLDGLGSNPHLRQQRSADRREEATRDVLARLGPARRAAFTRLLRWAQSAAPVREDALADIGLAWPPMRRMLRELGRRLVDAGVIAEPADVFWLRLAELRSAVDFGLAGTDGTGPAITGAQRPVMVDAVERRRMRWRGQRQAAAPQMLPMIPWLERAVAGLMPAGSQRQSGDVIHGVGASAGRVRAPACVLAGPEDFSRMRPGDVLVARMTTPAWTPLFAIAAAVVTDVGGPLSHSSIVAREYGIPAVLGTGVATQRIASGQQVGVDGDAGTVTTAGPVSHSAEATPQ